MRINFEFETEYGVYKDCLDFGDGAVPSDEEIERMKQVILSNWLKIFTNPPTQDISMLEEGSYPSPEVMDLE